MMDNIELPTIVPGDVSAGGDFPVPAAKRLIREGLSRRPNARKGSSAVDCRAAVLDVKGIDAAESGGENVSEQMIADALFLARLVL
jgi:hypothetical protein